MARLCGDAETPVSGAATFQAMKIVTIDISRATAIDIPLERVSTNIEFGEKVC